MVAVATDDEEQGNADLHNLPVATDSGSSANPACTRAVPRPRSRSQPHTRLRYSIDPKTSTITRTIYGRTDRTAPIEVAKDLPPRQRRNGALVRMRPDHRIMW
jgi:hypothetical protein